METPVPETPPLPSNQQGELPRYRRLHRNLILIPFLAALVPLVIMAAINYRQDATAYRAKNRYVVSRLLSNTKRSLQSAIEQRRSVLSLITKGRSREELSSNARLTTILRDLRESFGDFVDLGLIGSDGIQSYYAGPYDLTRVNYQDQPWFHAVSLRGVYVSDVFMGFRKFPHFVIAIACEQENGDFYVLRATIDNKLLSRQMYSLDEGTDAFIVNDRGILQTVSTFYGTVLDSIDLTIPPHIRDREIISEQDQLNGGTMTTGFTYVEGSPFILVAVSRHEAAFKHWFYQRADVIWFLVASVAGILLVVSMRSRHIVNRLRASDIRRARVHHNLEYTNKMVTLGRLAAGVAHEINNPLAIINEKAGLVRDIATHTEDFPRRDKILGIVDSITTSVDRCSRVTRRLLGFGRRMDAQKERVDLASLVNDVLEFQKTEAAYRRIQIHIDAAPDTQTIESDRGQLQQVFLNLISNAYAAVEDGGRINITISQPNSNEVAVTISDDGAGIPENDLKSIFEPFFSTKGEAGTGLGLSITRDLVEKLGGLIEVTSEVGKGTRFTVNLPVDKVG